MRVLSLFDGIAGARLSLDRAGLDYDEYIGVEINEKARAIADFNYDISRPCHDVKDIDAARKIGKVDLMIAGFPCQPFTPSGRLKGFSDERGGLYREMLRWREICNPDYWLFENVVPPATNANILNNDIGTRFITANSKFYGAQNRKRAFWSSHKFTPMTKENPDIIDNVLSNDDTGKTFSYTPLCISGKTVRILGATRYISDIENRKGCYAYLASNGQKVIVKQTETVFDRTGKIRALRTTNNHKIPISENLCRNLKVSEFSSFQNINPDYVIKPIIQGKTSLTQAFSGIGNGFDIAVVSDILSQMLRGNETDRDKGLI